MNDSKKRKDGKYPFKIERSFGMAVLLKLTKSEEEKMKTSDDGQVIQSNLSTKELSSAVDKTIDSLGIQLKSE